MTIQSAESLAKRDGPRFAKLFNTISFREFDRLAYESFCAGVDTYGLNQKQVANLHEHYMGVLVAECRQLSE
jgi:hypothetical protein